MKNLTFIVVAILLTSVGLILHSYLWEHCRAAGHSRFYCLMTDGKL